MRTKTTLALGALALGAGLARAQTPAPGFGVVAAPKTFEMPPYKIAVTPPGSAAEGAPIRIRAVATGVAAISQQVCRFEVWPEGSAHGATWAGASDPGCSREEAMTLPAGRYVVKLTMSWVPVARTGHDRQGGP